MGRFSLLILLVIILWVGWMSWEWLRNREDTPIVPNPNKNNLTETNNKNEETI